MKPPVSSGSALALWARIADSLALLLALAAAYVGAFGGIRIGTLFSMSTPWRALTGLVILCGVRHFLVPTPPIHQRAWSSLRSAARQLQHLPVPWARIADGSTVLLAAAAAYVTVFGGVRIGTLFSMSTPWRAFTGLLVLCGVRHFLGPAPAIHQRVWSWLRSAACRLQPLAVRCRDSPPVRLAVRCGRWSIGAYKRATRMTPGRALSLFTLTALAVAQPLFDVVSREPTFFVARNTTSGQLGTFLVIVGLALPALLVGTEAACTRLHAVAGTVVHFVLLTVLLGVLLLPPLKRADGLDTVSLLAVAALLAGGIAVGCLRSAVIRTFLTALSPAAVIVPAVFLANPDIRGALVGSDRAPIPARVEHGPPIVFVVFDEFPTSSLC